MREKIDELLEIMAALRTPETGCPWDLEQNFRTIAPYTIEEAYEVADAIERDDMSALKEELGDLLFQVVFHAQMAEEIGAFDFHDVASAIGEKMTRRHPHVFGAAGTRTAEEQNVDWERMKAAERANKGAAGLLDDVPIGMPALTRAVKLQKRAARVGFDWAQARDILAKVIEEAQELTHAQESDNADHIEEEFGDLLFVMANLARRLEVDPEAALRRSNEKFIRRFSHIERTLKDRNEDITKASIETMEELWMEAKKLEKNEA